MTLAGIAGPLSGRTTVADLMTAPAVTVEPTATVRQAANLMRGRSIGCLVVIESARDVGIVTVSDLLELVGRGLDRGVVTTKRWTLKHRAPPQVTPIGCCLVMTLAFVLDQAVAAFTEAAVSPRVSHSVTRIRASEQDLVKGLHEQQRRWRSARPYGDSLQRSIIARHSITGEEWSPCRTHWDSMSSCRSHSMRLSVV